MIQKIIIGIGKKRSANIINKSMFSSHVTFSCVALSSKHGIRPRHAKSFIEIDYTNKAQVWPLDP